MRGGGFLMFLLVLLPFTLLGVALVADYSRAIVAGRQVSNAADSVAMAAVTAFNESGDISRLDPNVVQERAKSMFEQAVRAGMLPKQYKAVLSSVSISGDRRTVTVVIEYRVPDLFVVRAISTEAETSLSGRVRRSATVCLPDDPARLVGVGCAYPLS
jgi:Flp pilus assembly protein TadG